jgi:hypothetical protein
VGALLVGDIDGPGVYAGLIRAQIRVGKPWEGLDHHRAWLAAVLARSRARVPV